MSVAFSETLFATFAPSLLSKLLGRRKEQREQAERLISEHHEKVTHLRDELQQKTLDWLTALMEGPQGLNTNAPHIYAFESALDRLEHELTDEQ